MPLTKNSALSREPNSIPSNIELNPNDELDSSEPKYSKYGSRDTKHLILNSWNYVHYKHHLQGHVVLQGAQGEALHLPDVVVWLKTDIRWGCGFVDMDLLM